MEPAQNVRKPLGNPVETQENLKETSGNLAETQGNPYIHPLQIKNI